MKEKYFTNINIDTLAGKLLDEAKSYAGKDSELTLNKDGYALLVLDMQDYFLRQNSNAFVPSAPAVIPKINSLIELFEHKKLPIFFSQHINSNENAGMMGKWWNKLISNKNELSNLSDLLTIPNGSIIFQKSQYDAFHNTALNDKLKAKDIDTLIICGVMTNLCVETTVRSSFVHGYSTVLPLDATAAYNYNYHRATALNLAFGFSHITLTKDIIKEVNKND